MEIHSFQRGLSWLCLFALLVLFCFYLPFPKFSLCCYSQALRVEWIKLEILGV
jgi:hypothetical protein